MNKTIFAVNLAVPLFVVLIILAIAGCLGVKKKESIKGELFEYFVRVWEADKKETEPPHLDAAALLYYSLYTPVSSPFSYAARGTRSEIPQTTS